MLACPGRKARFGKWYQNIYITYSTQKGIDFSLNTSLHSAHEDVALRGMDYATFSTKTGHECGTTVKYAFHFQSFCSSTSLMS
jgi:hypothetical protein